MGTINNNNDTNNNHIVGYRFHPTDRELVDHYLCNKIRDRDSLVQAIAEVEGLCNRDPWDLPCYSKIKSADQVWYFFSRRKENKRIKRTTHSGFWKVTGKTRNVKGKDGSATKRTLVFYEGRLPNQKWTPWVMHEYTFTSTVLDNKEGIFLCKLKKKEDEKADTSTIDGCQPSQVATEGTSTSEGCQPSQVADEGILENTAMFNPDEMLGTLKEPGNKFSPAPQPSMPMHEELVSFFEDLAYLNYFRDGHHAVQDLSDTDKLNDESWIEYLNDEVYPDEMNNEQVVESEGCSLRFVDTSVSCPGQTSRKRLRFENGGYRAIGDEECQATYEQVANASSTPYDHAGSKKIHALPMANAPNLTLTAVQHKPHRRERMLSAHIESMEMDASSGDSAVDLNCNFHIALCQILDYPPATKFQNPQYQEIPQNFIKQEDTKRVGKQEKFSGNTVSPDKARDVRQHITAVNLPQVTTVLESNMKLKTANDTNEKTSLKMHTTKSAQTDKKVGTG